MNLDLFVISSLFFKSCIKFNNFHYIFLWVHTRYLTHLFIPSFSLVHLCFVTQIPIIFHLFTHTLTLSHSFTLILSVTHTVILSLTFFLIPSHTQLLFPSFSNSPSHFHTRALPLILSLPCSLTISHLQSHSPSLSLTKSFCEKREDLKTNIVLTRISAKAPCQPLINIR